MILTIDLETYSPQDIGKVGAYRYAQDPDFEILLCSVAVGDYKVYLLDLKGPRQEEHTIANWYQLKEMLFDPKYTKRALSLIHI